MRFIIQRVSNSKVTIDNEIRGQIGKGFMVLIGVGESDTKEIADKMIHKMINLRIFEDENGEVENIFEDEVPYDLKADVIEILPEDYGIWYVDMMENQERYDGKVVEYTARVMKPRSFPSKLFFPGRMAMTCCADDTTFLGYICKSSYAPKLKAGQWVKVRAKVGYEKLAMYRGVGPVLTAENIELAEPIEELVYFN